MIVGSGMIAKTFSDYGESENVLVYAKGVSNSQEKDENNFKRETEILKSILVSNPTKTIIYFSTCSVYDIESKNSKYVLHKLKMERLIQDSEVDYYIFRLPQVVGNTTSPTLINFLSTKILNGERFDVWKNSKRNLIDVDDVYKICSYLIKNDLLKNSIVNVATEQQVGIMEIIKKIELVLKKSAVYNVFEKGSSYSIDITAIDPYLKECNVDFTADYIENLLIKYLIISKIEV